MSDSIFVCHCRYLINRIIFLSLRWTLSSSGIQFTNSSISMSCLNFSMSLRTSFAEHNWSSHHHHHHHVVPLVRISLTLSPHLSISFIASGRSLELHPVSSHNCCMYVRCARPAFDRPYVGVHRSTSLMSSSLFLQQCPACLVRLAWIVFVMGGRIVGVLWGVAGMICSILLVYTYVILV